MNDYHLIDSNNRLGVASPSQYANIYTEPLHRAISSFFSLSQDLVLLRKNGNLHSLRQSKDGSADVLRVEASHVVLLLLSSSLEVGIGKDHRSDLEVAVIESSVQSEEVQNMVTETTQGLSPDNSAPFLIKLSATPVFCKITLNMPPKMATT